ncbi:SPOR domain-containing protein [Desulfonatronum thiodismutans]|uniref:SPOR domain-containing protein n=1 Tax=Desulfonatronum thiodismutans TaxID=159290 RepID=UPI0004ABD5E7|nr:SPOR domain-containing protein [Desulfonatronum thiodismutans]
MAQKNSKPSTSSGGKKKRWRFELGPFGMLGVGLVGTLVMAWAFILGILVGRGYHPESVIPEIGWPPPSLPTLSTPRTVLQPEELRFHETLQERGSQPSPEAPRRAEPPRVSAPARQAPQVQQEAAVDSVPAPVVVAPPGPTSPTGQTGAADPVETGEPRFEFVYQVASFQNDAQAGELRQSIASAGLSASVEAGMVNDRQWYRVLVTVRGSQAEADLAKSRLQGLGIADPFLRAKKSL